MLFSDPMIYPIQSLANLSETSIWPTINDYISLLYGCNCQESKHSNCCLGGTSTQGLGEVSDEGSERAQWKIDCKSLGGQERKKKN